MIATLLRPLNAAAWWTLAVSALALVAVAFTSGFAPPPVGVPDPGTLTRWGLPAARAAHDAAAATTVGLLVLAALVLPQPPGVRELLGARLWAVRVAGISGAAWCVLGAITLMFTYADASGNAPFVPGGGDQLRYFVTELSPGRSMAASLLMAALVTLGAITANRVTTTGPLAAGTLVAMLPLALGHTAADGNHATAVTAQAAHLIGVSVWAGGLLALVMLRRRLGSALLPVLRRYSTLAGWCFVLVGGSGVLSAVTQLSSWSALGSDYGSLLFAKSIVLAALGGFGWHLRRQILGAGAGREGPGSVFARIAAVELALMAMAVGLAVALSRTSPPRTAQPLPSLAESLLGYPLPAPFTTAKLFTAWRLDLLWLTVAVLAVSWYWRAMWQLRRRGDGWPLGRVAAWTGGWLILVWATNAGPGVYGRVLFSAHMVQHMTIAMVVPVLLVLGAPITLALRTLTPRRDGSTGPREWLLALVHARLFRLVAHPIVAAAVFTGSLVIFYNSPLFEWALRTHTGHVLMTVHFLLAGYVFAWVICGADPGPPRPPYVFRILLLLVTFAFHAFIGIALMSSASITGGEWFAALPRDWGPSLAEDQNRGGAIAWGMGDLPVLVMAIAMMRVWIASDAREARRIDRQADRDGDAALAAYNAYLAQLDRHDPALARSGSPTTGKPERKSIDHG
ncbi:MAG: cytochrome c oxidase assembly protein [Sporichthyaceae bacterium]